jgi:prepilin-type N-terminal cleavage/methylation domain-containing protein
MFCVRTSARRSVSTGFSVVEMLIVLAIVGIILGIGGIEAAKAIQRQAPAAAAQDLEIFAKRAFSESQRRGVATFLRIAPVTAADPKVIAIQLWADGNPTASPVEVPDGALDTTKDTLIDTYLVPFTDSTGSDVQRIALSTAAKDKVEAANWSYTTDDDPTKERILECDGFGRAIDISQVPPTQITGAATLSVTHAKMVAGNLRPRKVYQLRISPAWGVQVVDSTY